MLGLAVGGQTFKLTTKHYGERVHIYVNGDFLLAVTPADARAAGHRRAAQLAPIWGRELARGFANSHSPVTRPAQ